jgi:hypothetical protein
VDPDCTTLLLRQSARHSFPQFIYSWIRRLAVGRTGDTDDDDDDDEEGSETDGDAKQKPTKKSPPPPSSQKRKRSREESSSDDDDSDSDSGDTASGSNRDAKAAKAQVTKTALLARRRAAYKKRRTVVAEKGAAKGKGTKKTTAAASSSMPWLHDRFRGSAKTVGKSVALALAALAEHGPCPEGFEEQEKRMLQLLQDWWVSFFLFALARVFYIRLITCEAACAYAVLCFFVACAWNAAGLVGARVFFVSHRRVCACVRAYVVFLACARIATGLAVSCCTVAYSRRIHARHLTNITHPSSPLLSTAMTVSKMSFRCTPTFAAAAR